MKKTSFIWLAWCIMQTVLWNACQETDASKKGSTDLSRKTQLHYGIKINAALCGYAEIDLASNESNGKRQIQLSENTLMMISALGSKFNSEIHSITLFDSASGQFRYQKVHIKQGPTDFTAEATVANDTIFVTSTLSEETARIALDPDVLLRNYQILRFIIKDFADTEVQEMSYSYFEMRDQEIQDATFRRIGSEILNLAGSTYDALVVEENNQKTGLKTKVVGGSAKRLYVENDQLARGSFSDRL